MYDNNIYIYIYICIQYIYIYVYILYIYICKYPIYIYIYHIMMVSKNMVELGLLFCPKFEVGPLALLAGSMWCLVDELVDPGDSPNHEDIIGDIELGYTLW